MITLKDLKEGKTIEQNPIYKVKPFVIVSKDNVVLSAGTIENFLNDTVVSCGYYDDCEVRIREYDLDMNDNTRIEEPVKSATIGELRTLLFNVDNQDAIIPEDLYKDIMKFCIKQMN